MVVMKRLALFVLSCAALSAVELADVHTVYLLKMSRGMDQYLANRFTNEHIFQVVTDPKMADAIVTDRIGEAFEAKLEELFPPPNPEPVKREPTPEKEEGHAGIYAEPVNKLSNPAANSSFGAATGTIFLVSAKSRQVIWSAYDLPRDSSSKELNRTASDVVNRIKRDLKKK